MAKLTKSEIMVAAEKLDELEEKVAAGRKLDEHEEKLKSKLRRQVMNALREDGKTIKTCTSCGIDYFIIDFNPIQDVVEIILVPDSIQLLKRFVIARIDVYDVEEFQVPIPDDISKKEQDEERRIRRIGEMILNHLNGVLKGMEKDKISLSLNQINTLQMELPDHFIHINPNLYADRSEEWDYIIQTLQKAQYDYTNDKCINCEKKGR